MKAEDVLGILFVNGPNDANSANQQVVLVFKH